MRLCTTSAFITEKPPGKLSTTATSAHSAAAQITEEALDFGRFSDMYNRGPGEVCASASQKRGTVVPRRPVIFPHRFHSARHRQSPDRPWLGGKPALCGNGSKDPSDSGQARR